MFDVNIGKNYRRYYHEKQSSLFFRDWKKRVTKYRNLLAIADIKKTLLNILKM